MKLIKVQPAVSRKKRLSVKKLSVNVQLLPKPCRPVKSEKRKIPVSLCVKLFLIPSVEKLDKTAPTTQLLSALEPEKEGRWLVRVRETGKIWTPVSLKAEVVVERKISVSRKKRLSVKKLSALEPKKEGRWLVRVRETGKIWTPVSLKAEVVAKLLPKLCRPGRGEKKKIRVKLCVDFALLKLSKLKGRTVPTTQLNAE
jgi:hypothetical protein